MSRSIEALDNAKDSLSFWERIGSKVLKGEIRRLAESLGVNIDEAGKDILSGQTLRGRVDLSSFKAECWALKQVVKKSLDNTNSVHEVQLDFSFHRQVHLIVTNPFTGERLFMGSRLNYPDALFLYSHHPNLSNELDRYREDQKFDAARNLLTVIRQTFIPIESKALLGS